MREKPSYDIEKREFIRIDTELFVEYRFIDNRDPGKHPHFYSGRTQNLSGGGLLLQGVVPDTSWVPDLLMGKILLGLKIRMPDGSLLKTLGKMAWVEKKENGTCLIGIRFKEITRSDQDRLVRMVIERHLP